MPTKQVHTRSWSPLLTISCTGMFTLQFHNFISMRLLNGRYNLFMRLLQLGHLQKDHTFINPLEGVLRNYDGNAGRNYA